MTITSSAITAGEAVGTSAFAIALGSFPSGETAIGDLTSFSISLGGQTMSETLGTVSLSNSTLWKDVKVGSGYVLESTWTAAHVFTTPFPGGTLQDVGNSTSSSTASYTGVSATGEWALQPAAVPLPASAWLLLSGATGLSLMARRRKIPIISREPSLVSASALRHARVDTRGLCNRHKNAMSLRIDFISL